MRLFESLKNVVLVMGVLATAAGCGGGGGDDGGSPRAAQATIAVTPASGALAGEGPGAGAEIAVTVLTKKGKPIARQKVALAVSPAGDCSVAPDEGTTGADGIVRATIVSTKAGTRTVTATVNPGTKRAFEVSTTVELSPGAPAAIALLSGDHQVAAAGAALGEPLAVRVTDAWGNAVPGATVEFTVAAGGGALGQTSVATGPEGRAETTLTLGTRAGPNVVEAAIAGAPSVPAVAFLAIGEAGAAAAIEIVSGDAQSARVASALPDRLVVAVRDAHGNLVPNAAVTFAVTAGDGTVAPDRATTDPAGRAATELSLGQRAGRIAVRAAIVSGASVTFAAHARAGEPHRVDLAAKQDFGPAGTVLAATATVHDRYQNPIEGALVTFALLRGAGAIAPPAATTDADGEATAVLTLGPGANEIEAAAGAGAPAAGPAVVRATLVAAGVVGNPIATADFTPVAPPGEGERAEEPRTLDLVLANAPGEMVSFYSGDACGMFLLEPFALQGGGQAVAVAAGDFDGDGLADVARVSLDGTAAHVFRNTTPAGAGALLRFDVVDARGAPVGKAPASLAASHLDSAANRSLDIAVANFGDDTVTVLLGDGTGAFPRARTVRVGARPMSIAATRYRRPDQTSTSFIVSPSPEQVSLPVLATANYGDGTVTILTGDGTGAFARSQDIAVGKEPTSIAASVALGGLLAAACPGDRRIAVLVPEEGATAPRYSVAQEIQLGAGSTPVAVAIDELTGDLLADLAVTTAEGKVLLFEGSLTADGKPTFAEKIGGFYEFAPPLGTPRPLGIAIADYDPLGIFGRYFLTNDMAVAHIGSDEPSILLNQQANRMLRSYLLAPSVAASVPN